VEVSDVSVLKKKNIIINLGFKIINTSCFKITYCRRTTDCRRRSSGGFGCISLKKKKEYYNKSWFQKIKNEIQKFYIIQGELMHSEFVLIVQPKYQFALRYSFLFIKKSRKKSENF
jgi:hypothetical protein